VKYYSPDPDPDNNPPASDPPASDPPPGDDPPASDPPAGGGDKAPDPFYTSLPDDWRNQIAGDDEARLNDLARYTSLDKWIESGFSAKDAIRKGEISTGLPENPSDEQLAEYRAANNIPETPDYKLTLEPGVELSDMEKEILQGVMGVAHQANISTTDLSALTGAWLQGKETQLKRMQDQDGLDKIESEKTMREHWGVDYDKNMSAAVSMLNGISEENKALIMEARDPEGRFLMSSPFFVQFLAETALKVNPMALIPGGGGDPMGTANSIIQKVKDIFAAGTEATDYYKDQGLQDQYERALELQQQFKKAGAKS